VSSNDIAQAIQVIANVGVIASILFLAHQLRQNTKVARQTAYNAFTQEINALNFSIANDGELAALLSRAGEGAQKGDFTAAERLRIELVWLGLVRVWEGLYRSMKEGIATEGAFKTLSTGFGPYRTPYFVEMWPAFRSTVDSEFAQFFEARVWPR
jgi:hypothetical protein